MSVATGNEAGTAQVNNTGGGAPNNRQRDSQQGRGNRGRSNRGYGGDRSQQHPRPKKFTGKEEGLGDEYVYQHTNGRDATDQYARTTEELIRYTSIK